MNGLYLTYLVFLILAIFAGSFMHVKWEELEELFKKKNVFLKIFSETFDLNGETYKVEKRNNYFFFKERVNWNYETRFVPENFTSPNELTELVFVYNTKKDLKKETPSAVYIDGTCLTGEEILNLSMESILECKNKIVQNNKAKDYKAFFELQQRISSKENKLQDMLQENKFKFRVEEYEVLDEVEHVSKKERYEQRNV